MPRRMYKNRWNNKGFDRRNRKKEIDNMQEIYYQGIQKWK